MRFLVLKGNLDYLKSCGILNFLGNTNSSSGFHTDRVPFLICYAWPCGVGSMRKSI
jgi:hypothetical protein